jgi:hypothetical protein
LRRRVFYGRRRETQGVRGRQSDQRLRVTVRRLTAMLAPAVRTIGCKKKSPAEAGLVVLKAWRA